METGSITRPSPIPALNAPQRTDTLAAAGAVRTELPPEAAVQQVNEAEPVRFEPTDGARERAAVERALQDVIKRRIEIEPKTREVVYQSVNQETGEVVRQVPDQALLRLRAYAREMREAQERGAEGDVRRVERIA
jgi:uncharacterized FlaG/YvyC family protein